MEKAKCPKVKKLSADMPEASLEQAKEKLTILRQLTSQSVEFSEEIGRVIAKLRQVPAPQGEPFVFTALLSENKQLLQAVFRDCSDIEFRSFNAGGRMALLVYLAGMADTSNLEQNVLKPLMLQLHRSSTLPDMKFIAENILEAASVTVLSLASKGIEAVMMGNALLLVDGAIEGISIGSIKSVKRSVQPPENEHVMKGPHEGFNESLSDNLVLIRRRVQDSNIKVQIVKVGERTKTSIAVVYAIDLVKPGLLAEVMRRLSLIKVDKVISAAGVEEFLIDHPWSPFPQVQNTERPDKVLAAIYEGRVVMLTEGTPVSMIVPCNYNVLMQAADDYTLQPVIVSLIRVLRAISAILAIYLPAIYVAIVSYHPGMLPTAMAISVAELRSRTPFPSFLEAFMMEVLLELFQEAVVRLPKKLAGAASMVGAFVIGTTVVQAGLINPLLVVIVATTAIASYSMPNFSFSMALRILRVPMLILASILGLYGVVLGALAVTIHLCSLRSFGESYLGGMFNVTFLSDWKDMIMRFPIPLLRKRPKEFGAQDETRIGSDNG